MKQIFFLNTRKFT